MSNLKNKSNRKNKINGGQAALLQNAYSPILERNSSMGTGATTAPYETIGIVGGKRTCKTGRKVVRKTGRKNKSCKCTKLWPF